MIAFEDLSQEHQNSIKRLADRVLQHLDAEASKKHKTKSDEESGRHDPDKVHENDGSGEKKKIQQSSSSHHEESTDERGTKEIKDSEMTPEKKVAVNKITALYQKYGASDYIGEAINQTQHAVQAAQLAKVAGFPSKVIVAALLHG